MQVWQKLGRVYVENGSAPWRVSHAYLPTAFVLANGTIRVALAFLDANGMGRVGFADVDSSDPTVVVGISESPSLDLGRTGTFDEHGVTPLCTVRHSNGLYLFYAGWQRSESVRYYLFTGLAVSYDDGIHFERCSEAPILDRRDGELAVRTGGFVFKHSAKWIFAYMGGSSYVPIGDKLTPTYDLMTLTSSNPTEWRGSGALAMAPDRPAEFGFGRPWVISEGGRARMWISVRSADRGYSLEYAESLDGMQWLRHRDELVFTGPNEEWDSRHRSFASIVDTEAGRFMFYNGNDFGAGGFGVARLVSDDFGSVT